jgi:hypothetical protein
MAGVTEFNQKENSIVHIKKKNGYQVKFEAGKLSDIHEVVVKCYPGVPARCWTFTSLVMAASLRRQIPQ